MINYAQVVQRAKSNQEAQKAMVQPQSPELKKAEPPTPTIVEPQFIPPEVPVTEPIWNRNDLISILTEVYDSFTSQPQLDTSIIYSPANPIAVPSSFPQTPKKELLESSVIATMDEETLLFAYSYALTDSQRSQIAKALVAKGWLFDKQTRTWVTAIVRLNQEDDV